MRDVALPRRLDLMRKVIVAVVGLLVLLVVADRLAAGLAARTVAQRVQASQQLATKPTVTIEGVPFLTQAISGRYELVSATILDEPVAKGLQIDRLDAALHGVRLSLADLLSGNAKRVLVDGVDVVGHSSFASLDAAVAHALPTELVDIRFTAAGTDRVRVSGRLVTPLGTLAFTGQAKVSVQDGRLTVAFVPGSAPGLPAVAQQLLARLLVPTVVLPRLPFGLTAVSVSVEPGGLTVSAHADHVVLPG